MCGIAGLLNLDHSPADPEIVSAMVGQLVHRGPDDEGFFLDGSAALGFRRLSIIDLSGGHQPMTNEDGSVWIVFNGEIYNFLELQDQLCARGHRLRTNSDTETIVHLYEEYGCDCVRHLNGMFAFGIWDRRRRRLLLARDRLGKKPLVYTHSEKRLAFASEISSLLQDPSIPRELDIEALDLYLSLLYVPAPRTMIKAVRKLPPAHYLVCEDGRVRIEQYWDLDFSPTFSGTESDAAAEVRRLLEDSVRRRLISDVPLGAFLSGGIDSSSIVALMSSLTGRRVKTFSVAFDDDVMGELPYARAVAEQYETDHHELQIKAEMVDVLPRLVRHYGEPFGDCSAVSNYYVSQFAKKSVTVALSGDGGDEVFGGYPWYIDAPRSAALAGAYLGDGVRSFGSALSSGHVRGMLGAVKGTALGLGVAWKCLRDEVTAFQRVTTFTTPRQRKGLFADGVGGGLPAAIWLGA